MSIVNLSQIAQALDAMMPELTPVPVGTIDFAHDVPEGWLECNGAAVSRTKYARLFKKIGTKYGAGDGSTTFNLPNLHHRVLEGTNTTNEVAKYQEAGLPDINGGIISVSSDDRLGFEGAWGCFSSTSDTAVTVLTSLPKGRTRPSTLSFRASTSNVLYNHLEMSVASLRMFAIIKT